MYYFCALHVHFFFGKLATTLDDVLIFVLHFPDGYFSIASSSPKMYVCPLWRSRSTSGKFTSFVAIFIYLLYFSHGIHHKQTIIFYSNSMYEQKIRVHNNC